jgi:hypothetical protein
MGPLNYTDAVRLVRAVLHEIKAYSPRAELAILMIIGHESGGGKFRRQRGGGPARGLIQMEPPTFDSVIEFGAQVGNYLRRAGYAAPVKCADLETDDRLSVVMARARLAMDPAPLPSDPAEMAAYLKRFWNGPGKATPGKYLNDWEKWKNAAID